MKRCFWCVISIMGLGLMAQPVHAGPDRFIGDSAIYTGEATHVRPNILFIFDNNSTMGNTASVGDPYNPATTYVGDYEPWTVYKVVGMGGYVAHISNDTSALTNVSCAGAKTALQTVGTYSGSGATELKSAGNCANGGAALVYLGNLLNYNALAGEGGTDAQVRVVRQSVLSIVNGTRGTINYGLMTFAENKSGGRVVRPVADISSDAAYNTFASYLPGTGSTGTGTGGGGTYTEGSSPAVTLLSGNGRPLAEALYDAGAYFKNVYPIISNYDHVDSPIAYTCQKNYVIVITNGDTDLDANPKLAQATALGTVGNYYAGDGYNEAAGGHSYGTGTHYMDDVAKFIYDNDMSSSLSGTQRVVTHAVQVFAPLKTLVQSATVQGHGSYYVAADANALSNALANIINSIVLEVNTAFVAPVVPISPENKTYSGSRLYMGLFKPISEKTWLGNIKKLGFNSSGQVIDKNNNAALNSDGSIKSTAVSFWGSSTGDGSVVDSGGVGALLLTATRNIYTYSGTSTSLTNSSNAFTSGNTAITHTTLDVSDSATKDKLVGFVRGTDSYDDDGDGNTTEKRSWIMGDVLHSRPLVVNYAFYTFTATNEADCSINKSMIYVGANDGMLHAFKDCDGSEAWAFIPPDMLPNLKYLRESSHSYFVDSTAIPYIYDADNDGTIESGDKVIIMFGERRGGGKDEAPTGGSYYALDVTDSANPVFLFRISNTLKQKGTTTTTTTDYSELAETWSEPKMVKVKIGSTDKIVAFIGAGYDNLNEDSRYGATQTYPSSPSPEDGNGTVTSSGTSSASNPKGRGVYAVEIAALDSSGVPSFSGSGDKVWGYTNSDSSNMAFSIPSEVAAIDADKNGYTDTIYVGDTGGNLWKFGVGSTSTSSWTATKIFSANPSSGSTAGKKIFYKPSVTGETGYYMLYFGTGDREHPLNRNVVDRIYAVKDIGQTSAKAESDLKDVTTDRLQASDATDSEIAGILSDLETASGWRIDLDQNSGEKVLSPTLVFNQSAYYTTYAPNISTGGDPCTPGNLGTARVYVLNYKTGEAVINYYAGNDGGGNANTRSQDSSGNTLERLDRVKTAGTGIPSGVVTMTLQGGETKMLMSVGGLDSGEGAALPDPGKTTNKRIIPIYWRQK